MQEKVDQINKNEFIISFPIPMTGGSFGKNNPPIKKVGEIFRYGESIYTIKSVVPEKLPDAIGYRVAV